MAILLYLEKILVEINPDTGITVEQVKELGKRNRSEKQLIVAEDSAVLRELLKDTLSEAGYVNVQFFTNGQLAWDYLEELSYEVEGPAEHVDLIISDLEMPQMDGHHLTRRIKRDEK